MRYRCNNCDATQWRGLFPEPAFHIRYVIFHGIALGVCGTCTKILFGRLGYKTDGWRNGLASLGVCAVLMLGFYGVAIVTEAFVMAVRPCRKCGSVGLRLV